MLTVKAEAEAHACKPRHVIDCNASEVSVLVPVTVLVLLYHRSGTTRYCSTGIRLALSHADTGKWKYEAQLIWMFFFWAPLKQDFQDNQYTLAGSRSYLWSSFIGSVRAVMHGWLAPAI